MDTMNTVFACLPKILSCEAIFPAQNLKQFGIQTISRTFSSPIRSSEQVTCSIHKTTERFSIKAPKLLSIKVRENYEGLDCSERKFSPKNFLWSRTIQFWQSCRSIFAKIPTFYDQIPQKNLKKNSYIVFKSQSARHCCSGHVECTFDNSTKNILLEI